MPSKREPRVFGVASTAFSGSTLLSFMLGAHHQVFATGEAYQLFGRYRQFAKECQTLDRCSVHQAHCDFWIESFSEQCERGGISDLYERITDYSEAISTVVHSFTVKVYEEILREGKPLDGLIVLFKRPVSYYSSRKQHNGSNVEAAADSYVSQYHEIRAFAESQRLPVVTLFYEDLAATPQATLQSLCDWMGLTYDPVMTTPWNAVERLHTIGGNAGTYMHLWDEAFREKMLKSPYWQEVHGERGRLWLLENYRKIRLDERWKSLPPGEIQEMAARTAAQEMFEDLMVRRSSP